MPLAYDDVPGSWGRMSEGWPQWDAPNEQQYHIAHLLCGRGGIVPYGSYVCMQPGYPRSFAGAHIRCETQAQCDKLAEVMRLLAEHL